MKAFDIIPNSWLKSSNLCCYPNANFKVTNVMAKNCSKPEDDWADVEISVIKKDYGKWNIIISLLYKSSATA